MSFSEAYHITSKHEGGYAHVEGDRGGETYRGIARNHHPDWQGWSIIDQFKKDQGTIEHNAFIDNYHLDNLVQEFYYKKFYEGFNLHKFIFKPLAIIVYDAVVHSGGWAVEILQDTCNDLYCTPELAVDKVLGPLTVARVNMLCREPYDARILHDNFRTNRISYLWELGERTEFKKFQRGWLRRARSFPQLYKEAQL